MKKLDHDFDGRLKGFERQFTAERLQDYARNARENQHEEADVFDGHARAHYKDGFLLIAFAGGMLMLIAFAAMRYLQFV